MNCCSRQCAIPIIGGITATVGLTLILLYHIYVTTYITVSSHFLVVALSNQSQSSWKEASPLNFSVYLYNWTNPEDVLKCKWKISPELKECSQYVFLEHQTSNINETVTSQQFGICLNLSKISNRMLDDNITNVNPTVSECYHFNSSGGYAMYTGETDLKSLGTLQLWNGNNKTGSITGSCDYIEGTSRELFHSVLEQNKTAGEVAGKQYTATDFNADNNTKYSSRACFIVPYPNFAYVLPNIVIPVEAKTQFQVNYYIEPEPNISIFEEPTPQSRSQPKSYTFVINVLISLSSLAIYIGWSLFGFGLVLLLLGIYILLIRNRESNGDPEQLILDQDDNA